MKVTLSVVNDGMINEIAELTAEEFTSINQALHWFHELTASQRLYLIIHLNNRDYKKKLQDYIMQFAKDGIAFRKYMPRVATDMNRRYVLEIGAVFLDYLRFNH